MPKKAVYPGQELTAREVEVLRLLAIGLRGPEIAERLFLVPGTVATHTHMIRCKLEAGSDAHAVLIAERLHRHLLKGVIVRHGTEGALRSHQRYGTPVCPKCRAFRRGGGGGAGGTCPTPRHVVE